MVNKIKAAIIRGWHSVLRAIMRWCGRHLPEYADGAKRPSGAHAAGREIVKVLGGHALLLLLCVTCAQAAPRPKHWTVWRNIEDGGVMRLELSSDMLQGGTTSTGNFQFDPSLNLKVNCITGCSASSGFTDNSAFTVGTSTINVMGAYFTSGADPACTTGNGCRLRIDSASNLRVNCIVGCAGGSTTPADAFANPSTAGLQFDLLAGFNGTTWDRLRSTIANGLQVDVTRVQGTVTVNNTQQGTASQNVAQWNAVALGSPSAYGTSPGAVNVPGVNAFITNTPAVTLASTTITGTVDVSDRAARLVGQVEGRAASGAAKAGNPNQIGGVFNTTQPTVTTGQAVELQASARGELFIAKGVSGFSIDNTSFNVGTFPANQPFNVAQINAVTPLMGNGVTGTGSQRVTIASDNTAFAVNATLSAETTKVIGTVRTQGNLGAAFDAATGAAPPANALLVGGLTSGATGGFMKAITVCDTPVNVNVVTATTTLLVTGVAGRHVRICSFDLMTAGANNVALISGTGATCGTGTTGMNGGTTAATGWNFAANQGMTQGSGLGEINRTNATGDSVCLITSTATQLSGRIFYAIY